MAGREFGPPPTVITEFSIAWRNWLYLLFQKVYKRRYTIAIQAIDGIGDGNASNTMQEGLIGIAPVVFGTDNKRLDRNYSGFIPGDWVVGTDIEFGITFANVDAQAGVRTVVTELVYSSTPIGGDLGLAGTSLIINSALPNNVAANTLHLVTFTITPDPLAIPGYQFQFELARLGTDANDTCSGDVGYKLIVFRYQGFINHE